MQLLIFSNIFDEIYLVFTSNIQISSMNDQNQHCKIPLDFTEKDMTDGCQAVSREKNGIVQYGVKMKGNITPKLMAAELPPVLV